MPSDTDSTATFRLCGEQTVQTIAETHQALADLVAKSNVIVIDVSAVTDADLTLVQLIEAARRSAAREGKRICMTSPPPETLRGVLVRGGFLNSPDNALFWSAP